MNLKGILGIIAAVLFIVLQIANIILSVDIEHLIGNKSGLMELKADDIQRIIVALGKKLDKEPTK